AATAALPAQRRRCELDQFARRISGSEVVGDADGDGAAAILALQHDGDDTRADALLLGIDEALHVLGRDAFDGAADIGDAVARLVGRRRGRTTAAERQLLVGVAERA